MVARGSADDAQRTTGERGIDEQRVSSAAPPPRTRKRAQRQRRDGTVVGRAQWSLPVWMLRLVSRVASAQDRPQGDYVEEALREKFERDGIPVP